MQPHDIKPMTEALQAAFDALGARSPGDAGVKQWFRALKGFPVEDVVDSLDSWVMSNRRAPTPTDIVDACQERGIRRREKQTEQWKAEEHNGPYTMGATPQGRAALAKIKQMVARMQRPQRGRQLQWADRVIDRYVDGDPTLSPIAFDFACEALGKSADDKLALRAMAATRKAA
jgi:hypothetical protein